ncbi:MAG: hypothetical protein JRN20_20535 [Nitrososphaerota archaeon]|nr:hypothetical protein [Nitrososphaerota archaeon]
MRQDRFPSYIILRERSIAIPLNIINTPMANIPRLDKTDPTIIGVRPESIDAPTSNMTIPYPNMSFVR